MRAPALITALTLALAAPACGGGDDDGGEGAGAERRPGTITAPAAMPDQTEEGATLSRADFESCVDELGLQVLDPEEQVPGTEGGRLEVGTESAEQLAVYWPESEHVADVFIAEDADAADQTEQELIRFFGAFGGTEEQVRQFVQRAGNVIVSPDNDQGPDAEELAAVRGCIG